MGVGGFGQHWSEALLAAKGVEVVGLVDVSEEALAITRDTCGYGVAICFPSLEEALASVTADMLLCVTPPQFHREHITTAVAAGLHVLVEKPLATTLADCIAIVEAARAYDRIVAVSQQYRYHPEMQALAKAVRQGAIGQIGQVKLDFYKGWYFDKGNFRRTMPYPLLVDMSIHHFDLLRFITGLEAVSIQGQSWNPPWSENEGDTSTSLTMTMNNGARVVYSASWCAQGDFSDWNGNWLIEGDKGSLVYEKGAITLNHGGGRYTVSASEAIKPPEMALVGQRMLLARFIDSVHKNQKPGTDVADNIRSIAMVFAAVEAVQTGRPTPVLTANLEDLLEGEKT